MKWTDDIIKTLNPELWEYTNARYNYADNSLELGVNGAVKMKIDVYSWLLGAEAIKISINADNDVYVDLDMPFDGGREYLQMFVDKETKNEEAIFYTNERTAKFFYLSIFAKDGAKVFLSLEHSLLGKEAQEIMEKELPVLFFAENTQELTIGTTSTLILTHVLENTRDTAAVVHITITGTSSAAQVLTVYLNVDNTQIKPILARNIANANEQVTLSGDLLVLLKAGVHTLNLMASVSTGTFKVGIGNAVLIGQGRFIQSSGLGASPYVTISQKVDKILITSSATAIFPSNITKSVECFIEQHIDTQVNIILKEV